jgi:hypothetical protein
MKEVKVEETGASAPPAYSRHCYKQKMKPASTPQPKFKGRCDGIKGFVFDCADGKQSDCYNVAMKELAEYVGREYTHGGDIRWMIENTKLFTVLMSKDPPNNVKATAMRIWERIIDECIKWDNKLTTNREAVYSLIMGQCTEYARSKLEGLPEYNEMNQSFDMFKLIKSIK